MSDDLIPRIFEKVEKISDDVVDIKIIAAKHDENLKEHMRRTSALENMYQHLDESRIQPLETSINKIKGIYGFIVFLSLLATIALVFVEYFKK